MKENELQYLKKEVQCLRDELQMMQKVGAGWLRQVSAGGALWVHLDARPVSTCSAPGTPRLSYPGGVVPTYKETEAKKV